MECLDFVQSVLCISQAGILLKILPQKMRIALGKGLSPSFIHQDFLFCWNAVLHTMVSGAKQRPKLLAAWGKDLGMNFGKLEKPNSTKICLDHKECFGNSLQMSGERLEEQAVNIPYETRENSTISSSRCRVCPGASKEKLCFPCPVNSPHKILLDAPRAEGRQWSSSEMEPWNECVSIWAQHHP